MDPTEIPFRLLPTAEVAPGTHVIRQLFGEGLMPQLLQLNTMVITGAEPVIVDTGVAFNMPAWRDEVFSIVEPTDVRWIYISHDDNDHVGGLVEAMALCPQATVVTTAFMAERMSAEIDVPFGRMRWMNPGDTIDAGDRTFVAVVPPTFDSPTTRGLFDTSTGVYWAADSFGVSLPHAVDDVRELDPDQFRQGFLDLQRLVSPWHRWLDPVKYGRHLDEVAALGATVIASCHGVTLRDESVAEAFELLRRLPEEPPIALATNDDLAVLQELFEAVAA
jgi:flavorubredoxin